jgi:protocatechuate 3,4-dioxygenase beta subunit
VQNGYMSLLLSLLLAGMTANEPAVTLSGTVIDADGEPVVGANLFLSDGRLVNPRGEFLSEGQVPIEPKQIERRRSDDSGRFSMELPNEVPQSDWARTWLVLWAHRNGSALTTHLVPRDSPPRAAPVTVGLPAASPLSLVVVSPDEKPVVGARVLPEQVHDARLPRELAEQLAATTDDLGRAALHDLDPASIDLVRLETNDYGVQLAALSAAERDGSRRVHLLPAAMVRGQLAAADPRAVSGIRIRFASWVAAGDDSAGVGLAETVSDAEGRFQIPAIVAGALSAAVELKAELPFRCQPIIARTIEEGKANDLVISLERAVRVEGVVRDRDSGEPLAGAAVWFDPLSPPANDRRTDEHGRYLAFLLPGQTTPSVRRIPRHYYFPYHTLDTQPVPKDVETVELKPLLLARGETLLGRVVDRDGQSVAGAEIEAHWELASGGETSLHADSDREGAFTLYGVEANAQLNLSAWSDHGATADVVVVTADVDNAVELVVDALNALALEGRVLDSQKRPVAGAVVRLRWRRTNSDGSSEDEGYVTLGGRQRTLTDAEGRFHTPAALLRGLEYRAEVASSGMLPAVTEWIDPVAWNTRTFGDIELPASPALRDIEGRVVDRRGRPLVGVRVFQTGDGPRRTETTSDREGRFRLHGVYARPVFALVGGDGCPLQGFLIDASDKPVDLAVRRDGEPAARRLTTLEAPLTPAERRETALRLIEPLLPALKVGGLEAEKVWVLRTLAGLDPNRVSEFSRLPVFAELSLGADAEYQAALALVDEDLAEALSLGEAIGDAYYRGLLYLAACGSLPQGERTRKVELLTTALLHARAVADAGNRLELIGQIAERWLDLGDIDRGRELLREGQTLAEELPPPSEAAERAHELAPHRRARFAGSLARIDGPAAIKLSSGFSPAYADRYRLLVVRGLAAHDPVAAERLLEQFDFPDGRYSAAVPALHRMTALDPRRAARLARKCEVDYERGYALGIVAHGVAPRDAAQAAALLDEAYDCLEQASVSGADVGAAWEHPSVIAAALLPVAERIDLALVDTYLWRAMALRSPRAPRIGARNTSAAITGALAMSISRYDPGVARVLVAPLAAQIQTLTAASDYWTARIAWASLATVDPARVESLIGTLPEPPPRALRAAKNVARRNVAEALAPAAGSWWHKLYGVPYLRDPNGREDEW